jgi:GAF domain-containing protein
MALKFRWHIPAAGVIIAPMSDYAKVSADAELQQQLRGAVQQAGAEEGSILLLSEDGHALQFVVCESPVAATLMGIRQSLDRGITGLSFSLQQPMVVNDVERDPAFDPGVQERTQVRTRSIMVVPLVSPDQEFGALTAVNSHRADGFTSSDLEAYGEAARRITERLAALNLSLPALDDGAFN